MQSLLVSKQVLLATTPHALPPFSPLADFNSQSFGLELLCQSFSTAAEIMEAVGKLSS